MRCGKNSRARLSEGARGFSPTTSGLRKRRPLGPEVRISTNSGCPIHDAALSRHGWETTNPNRMPFLFSGSEGAWVFSPTTRAIISGLQPRALASLRRSVQAFSAPLLRP